MVQMEQMIRKVMQKAPEMMHHIYSLEGANEVLMGLRTQESIAAYLLRTIAIVLYKTSRAADQAKPSAGPNDIHFHILRSNDFFHSFPTGLDLGDFEDLYYATCAKLKDLMHRADLFLANGFKLSEDRLFKYQVVPLSSLGYMTLGQYKSFLVSHEEILHSREIMRLLDHAIINKAVRETDSDKVHNYINSYQSSRGKLRDSKTDLSLSGPVEDLFFQQRVSEKAPVPMSGSNRLRDTSDKSCSMIFAELAEKYGCIPTRSDSMSDSDDRNSGLSAPAVEQKSPKLDTTLKYISPYNLDERAKKLDSPDGPDMPCICDPECICAPLCAGDLTQNCLCEENGLFVRVTQGMDIDELDVPDLIRQEEYPLSPSMNREALSNVPSADLSMMQEAWDAAVAPLRDDRMRSEDIEPDDIDRSDLQRLIQTELERGHSEHVTPLQPDQFQVILSSGNVATTECNEYQPWMMPLTAKRRTSNVLYREALREPFSKRCDTPPRHLHARDSIGKCLFGSKRVNRIPYQNNGEWKGRR